jgi:membrane-bound serine protease (ClpP class)
MFDMPPAVNLADPNIALMLLILGVAAFSWELHAPGLYLPGMVGAILISLGVYGLYLATPTWYGSIMLAVAVGILLFELKSHTHPALLISGTLLLALSTFLLFIPFGRLSPAIGISVSLAFGIVTGLLGYLGLKAQNAPARTGVGAMVGETGLARTAIDPEGTVLVHGEYWHARSRSSIAEGQRVSVRAVEGLVLEVEAI